MRKSQYELISTLSKFKLKATSLRCSQVFHVFYAEHITILRIKKKEFQNVSYLVLQFIYMLPISQGPKQYDGRIREVSQVIYSTLYTKDFDLRLNIS